MRKGLAAILLATAIAAICVGIASWLAVRQGPDDAGAPGNVVRASRPGELTTIPPRLAPSESFKDSAGKTITLNAFRGKTVVLNLWATWCPPCVQEMPSLDRLSKALNGQEFAVVALSQDYAASVAASYFAAHRMENLAPYFDERASVARALGAQGLPTTFIIDRDGRVVASMEGGAAWDSPAMIAQLQTLSSQSKKKE